MPGHAFPTGDLFRRLEIGAATANGARVVRYLGRRFEVAQRGEGRVLTADERVGDAPISVALDLGDAGAVAASGSISWWVTYQRVATVGRGDDPALATIESQITLHGGTL